MFCYCITFEFVLAMPQPCPVHTAMEWMFHINCPTGCHHHHPQHPNRSLWL